MLEKRYRFLIKKPDVKSLFSTCRCRLYDHTVVCLKSTFSYCRVESTRNRGKSAKYFYIEERQLEHNIHDIFDRIEVNKREITYNEYIKYILDLRNEDVHTFYRTRLYLNESFNDTHVVEQYVDMLSFLDGVAILTIVVDQALEKIEIPSILDVMTTITLDDSYNECNMFKTASTLRDKINSDTRSHKMACYNTDAK